MVHCADSARIRVMEIILGLMFAAGSLLVLLVAPIISWVRSARLGADLRELQAPLRLLEAELRELRARVTAAPTVTVLPRVEGAAPLSAEATEPIAPPAPAGEPL